MSPRVLKYQMNFKLLTLKMYRIDRILYDKLRSIAILKEFKKGCCIKKEYKPTKNGTRITFRPMETIEEFDKYYDHLIHSGELIESRKQD